MLKGIRDVGGRPWAREDAPSMAEGAGGQRAAGTFGPARRRPWLLAVAAALALAATVVLAACSNGGAASSDAAASADASGENASTALVVYANGNDVLLVDTQTDTPYWPTIPEEGIVGLDGNVIPVDDLQVGNIVAVEGDGIMLESYPGQYPGITSMTVVEQGSPADAEAYQELVDTVYAPVDEESVPTASLSYRTDLANATVMLPPYSYRWNAGADGETEELTLSGSFADDNGLVLADVPDAVIAAGTQGELLFDRGFQALEVSRLPVGADEQGQALVDLKAQREPVDHETPEGGTATFAMEPGYVYEVAATFANGEASFAFIAKE